jgi:CRISPR/Cas system-associated exonuclease Cas4 (RecB family)
MNNKKEVVPLRTRKGSIYQKGTNETFKISRSKFSNFLDCKRCFYLERVKGLKDPSMPGWSLNSAVDDLLKKEFDEYRKLQKPHPFVLKNKLKLVPFQHEQMDHWRNALSGGISYLDENTNIQLHGGLDDIWIDPENKQLVVVDYKAQSNNTPVETVTYLESQYHQVYKIQMDVYVHILRKMKFKVSDTAYFLVCNAIKTPDSFDAKLQFDLTLVPYKTDTSWVETKITEMKATLESPKVPEINKYCEKCMYLDTGKKFI